MSRIIELRNGPCRARVSISGGAILDVEASGIPLLSPSRTPGLATRVYGSEACFPMVPFCGRIEQNGFRFGNADYRFTTNTDDPLVLHGDGWLREWSVARTSPAHVDLTLEVAASCNSPYAYRAEQRIALLPDGIRLNLSVENRGPNALPFGIGFHPYLPVTPESKVQFEAAGVWSEGDLHLPGERQSLTGSLDFSTPRPISDIWINNAFENWKGRAVISHSSGHQIILDADPIFGWLMVYKPVGLPGFLCLEPMSHRPNSHGNSPSNGLVTLGVGRRMSGAMIISLHGHQ